MDILENLARLSLIPIVTIFLKVKIVFNKYNRKFYERKGKIKNEYGI